MIFLLKEQISTLVVLLDQGLQFNRQVAERPGCLLPVLASELPVSLLGWERSVRVMDALATYRLDCCRELYVGLSLKTMWKL